MAPNMAKPTTKPMALAAENTRFLNSRSGMTGSLARRSATRNSSGQHHAGHRRGRPSPASPRRSEVPPRLVKSTSAVAARRQQDRAQVVDDPVDPARANRAGRPPSRPGPPAPIGRLM